MAISKKATPQQSKPNQNKVSFIVLVALYLKKNRVSFGWFFVTLSLFLTFAGASYILDSWSNDQSLEGLLQEEFNNEREINIMGRLGAFIAEGFIRKFLGIASFLYIPILLLFGIKLILRSNTLIIGQYIRSTIILSIYFSVLLGFIFREEQKLDYFGGIFGYTIQKFLQGIIGYYGVLLILTIMPFAWIINRINLKKLFSFMQNENLSSPSDFQLREQSNLNSQNYTKQQGNKFKDPNITLSQQEELKVPDNFIGTLTIPKTNPSSVLDEIAKEINAKNRNQKQGVDFIITPTNSEIKPINEKESIVKETINRGSLYEYPVLSILKNHESGNVNIDSSELEERKNLIIETLENYKITIDKISATIGPTVTLYEIVPSAGIRISKIKNLEDDIALSLSALGIRIIAPMPGKGTIGIEVPNKNPQIVSFKEAIASEAFRNSKFDLPIVLGKTISNEVFIADLTKMPHLLMAGATGQGKSVGINTIISSILYKKHPEDVKFVLIDPKKVELSLYKELQKHFLPTLPDGQEAIITDTKMVVDVLKSLCVEMDDRYEKLKNAGVRNIKEYNEKIIKGHLDPIINKRLPFIVLVIDELADLMMTAGKEVELPIARLAQLARAIGIHLIVATQRPSVNIITGVIKANFPARMAFRVSSKIDSRTILDAGGAEQLIGKGDMLFANGNDVIRLQCPFIDTDESEMLCKHISEQPFPETFRLNIYSDSDDTDSFDDFDGDLDSMFEEAARMIVRTQQGSTSMLQRKLKLGYNRAGRVMDQLEKAGIVGSADGSKPREVLISDEYALEQFLSNLKK